MATRVGRSLLAALAVAVAAGCDLDPVTVAEPESRVVAEVYLIASSQGTRARAFLHPTEGGSDRRTVPGARIRLSWDGGRAAELPELDRSVCVADGEVGGGIPVPESEGSCYGAESDRLPGLGPGDTARVEVELPDGGNLRGQSRIPGEFRLLGAPGREAVCALPPDTPLPLQWTGSEGAWAYATETLISGLEGALSDPSVQLPSDPLFLLGLSVSAADTSIVYPDELGVFDRFDLDRELALALQGGLPAGTSARVDVGALDRNYVNWVRGGSFNPSGQVRIPSLRGDGSGVIGAVVVRSFRLEVGRDGLPPCLGEVP